MATPSESLTTENPSDSAGLTEFERLGTLFGVAIVTSVIAILLAVTSWVWAQAVGITVLAGLVGMALGALLGFLFGIPRSTPAATPDPSKLDAATPHSPLKPNTNLEELSDWLTKIIVGVGLTQIYQLPTVFNSFRSFLTSFISIGDATVATLLFVFGLISGFLWFYLETRTALTRVLTKVDSLTLNLTKAITQIASALPENEEALAAASDSLKAAAKVSPANTALQALSFRASKAAEKSDGTTLFSAEIAKPANQPEDGAPPTGCCVISAPGRDDVQYPDKTEAECNALANTIPGGVAHWNAGNCA